MSHNFAREQVVIGDSEWIEAAKRALKADGAVAIHFIDHPSWYELRKSVYRQVGFVGCQIYFNRNSERDVYVLIVNEAVRTSRELIKEFAAQRIPISELNYPERQKLEDLGKVPEFGEELFRCACCGEYLPIRNFAKRDTKSGRQSYCRSCSSLYKQWRYHFLIAHKARQLTPRYTNGGRTRNELFYEWFKSGCKIERKVK